MWFLVASLVLLNIGQGFLVYRGARRLLQFDTLFQNIIETLQEYSDDLVRMTSSDIDDILTDHPEVIKFHMRNMRARLEVQKALEDISKETPKRSKAPALPRPDVE